jgi:hypothetical protein
MKNFIFRFLFSAILVTPLLLTACGSATPVATGAAPTAPVPSLPSPEDCLIGEWELYDFADTIQSMLPSDINFQYAYTDGRIHWTFDVSGVAVVNADNFSLAFADKKDPSLVVVITTNGEALRDYKITGPGEITFSQAEDSQLTYTATVNGVTVNVDQLLQGLVPSMPANGTIAYRCSGNSLDVIPQAPGAVPEGFVKVR